MVPMHNIMALLMAALQATTAAVDGQQGHPQHLLQHQQQEEELPVKLQVQRHWGSKLAQGSVGWGAWMSRRGGVRALQQPSQHSCRCSAGLLPSHSAGALPRGRMVKCRQSSSLCGIKQCWFGQNGYSAHTLLAAASEQFTSAAAVAAQIH